MRQARPGDAPAVGAILAEALSAKYRPALGRRAAAGVAGMVRDEVLEGGAGFVVALDGDEPVGAAHLGVAEATAVPRFGRRLAARVGLFHAARAILVLSLLRQAPLTADEAHVGEVAVAAGARRQGVATALLQHLEERAAEAGKARITLWVTTDNTPAVTLYARRGYVVVRRRRWPLGRLMFGAGGIQLMQKRLRGDECAPD